MKNNLNLTTEEFYQLVEELKRGNEKLFEMSFRKLVTPTFLILKSEKNVNEEDAKDAVLNAIYKFRDLLIKEKIVPKNINSLFFTIAKNEYRDIQKKKKNIVSINENIIQIIGKKEKETSMFSEGHFALLKKAMNILDDYCSKLLQDIYYTTNKEKLSVIAKRKRINYDLLRKRKQRCLENLRKILKPMIEELEN